MSQPYEKYKNSVRHELMQGFDRRIKEAMRLRSITQLGLSSLISVSQPEISYYCRGKAYPRVGVIQQLAYHLNVSYLWLKYGTGEVTTKKEDLIKSFHLSFQERLVWLLWNNNTSPVKLAKSLNCSSTTVSHWCEGDRVPNLSNSLIFADHFNVELDWLIEGNEKYLTYEQANELNISVRDFIRYLKQDLRYDDLIR